MKRHPLCGAPALIAIAVATPVAAQTHIAPPAVTAKVPQIIADTPQGFVIVAARNDICARPAVTQTRLGSSVAIDAALLDRSIAK